MRWSHSLTQNLVSGCESEAHRRVSKQVSHSCSCSNFCFDSRCLHAQPFKWQLFFAVLLEILEAETRRVAEKSSAFGYLRFTASSSRRDASGCRLRCFRCEARTEDSYSKIAGCSAMGQFVEAVNQKSKGMKKTMVFWIRESKVLVWPARSRSSAVVFGLWTFYRRWRTARLLNVSEICCVFVQGVPYQDSHKVIWRMCYRRYMEASDRGKHDMANICF